MTIQQYPLQVSVRKEAMKAQSRVSHESVHSLVLATDSQDYYSNGRVRTLSLVAAAPPHRLPRSLPGGTEPMSGSILQIGSICSTTVVQQHFCSTIIVQYIVVLSLKTSVIYGGIPTVFLFRVLVCSWFLLDNSNRSNRVSL